MSTLKRCITYMPVVLILVFVILLLLSPEKGRDGARLGLMLCGRVIIPALFPFAVAVLFIMRSGALRILRKIEGATRFLFGQNSDEFVAFLLSLIGGYPVGGRLIRELYDNGQTDCRRAHILQCCSVNAGPAFVVIAVGSGILGSRQLGYILLLSVTLSSVVLALLCSLPLKKERSMSRPIEVLPLSVADNFVNSTADAAASVFGICAYVILFAVINAYFKETFLAYLTEVTTAVTLTNNVYVIAFLIGFSGLSVWFQLLSVSGELGIALPIFVLSRLAHGTLSALFTYLFVLLFKPTLETFSNGARFDGNLIIETPALAIALLSMAILFCISLFRKKRGGNLLQDVI